MTWDTTLNLDGATMRGAVLPTGRHLVEISDFKVGSVQDVGPRGEFTLKAVEGPDRGKTIRLLPYIPGKDFKGSEGQANWGRDTWFTLVSVVDVDPSKVNGKPADKIGKALVGQQLVVVVGESDKRETPAEKKAREIKGQPAPKYTNVDLMLNKSEWSGYDPEEATLPAPEVSTPAPASVEEADTAPTPSSEEEESSDGFSLDELN